MSDILQKILATKRMEIEAAQAQVSREDIVEEARDASPVRDFVAAITRRVRPA